jgi:hypothetical protein
VRVFRVSCATGAGIEDLKRALFDLCPAEPPDLAGARPAGDEQELADYVVYAPRPRARREYRIFRTDRGFRVTGSVPGEEELEAALKAAGARRGSVVEIGDEGMEVG